MLRLHRLAVVPLIHLRATSNSPHQTELNLFVRVPTRHCSCWATKRDKPFAAASCRSRVFIRGKSAGAIATRFIAASAAPMHLPSESHRAAARSNLLRPERRTSRRAAAQGGTTWPVSGGSVRSGPGCHPAPVGAVGRWLAREASSVVSPHGLKPCATPQSPSLAPTDVCPQSRGPQRRPVWGAGRRLRGGAGRGGSVRRPGALN